MARQCVQITTEKIGEERPIGYTHGKAAQRSTKDSMVWLHLLPGSVPFGCGESGAIRGCWKPLGISNLRGVLLPRPSWEEKPMWRWMDKWTKCSNVYLVCSWQPSDGVEITWSNSEYCNSKLNGVQYSGESFSPNILLQQNHAPILF